jgi:NADH-quinone oxidoreductase subunit N
MSQYYTAVDHFVLLPAILLALFGCGVLLFDFMIPPAPKAKRWLLLVVIAGVVCTGIALAQQTYFLATNPVSEVVAFRGALILDGFSVFFNWIFLIASFLVAIVSYRYLEIENEEQGEYYGLILLANCGMFFLAAATDLITIFVGLELMAICFYVMVGYLRRERRSNEAAVKYFLLGAFSSGFLAYGFSLLYGLSGSTHLRDVAAAISAMDPWNPVLFLALATTSVGLLFKISVVPFHMWAPDAYEGAPTTITAYLAVASKAASFALLMRLFLGPFAPLREVWEPLIIAVAVATLTLGNLAAISQTNIKRLLAYSSISHAGYILLGLIAGNETGIQGMAVYILMYTFMTLGAFMVIVVLRRKEILGEDLDDISGLAYRSPGYAVLMLIFLISLAGIPPTAGFIAKYFIFLALIQTGHYILAAAAALYVAVAIYYYFRIVRSMFMGKAMDQVPVASSLGVRFALGVTGILTLLMGIYPEPFIRMAQSSVLR